MGHKFIWILIPIHLRLDVDKEKHDKRTCIVGIHPSEDVRPKGKADFLFNAAVPANVECSACLCAHWRRGRQAGSIQSPRDYRTRVAVLPNSSGAHPLIPSNSSSVTHCYRRYRDHKVRGPFGSLAVAVLANERIRV
jgi:hypothetical protein